MQKFSEEPLFPDKRRLLLAKEKINRFIARCLINLNLKTKSKYLTLHLTSAALIANRFQSKDRSAVLKASGCNSSEGRQIYKKNHQTFDYLNFLDLFDQTSSKYRYFDVLFLHLDYFRAPNKKKLNASMLLAKNFENPWAE